MGSDPLITILDANVLYPFFQRDLLLNLGYEELYIPKWTDEIEQEWVEHLKMNLPDISEKLQRTVLLMNRAFPDAKVTGYQPHIEKLSLPDKNDRHVLASAIECEAEIIVTHNLSDFPDHELSKYNIRALDPDAFVMELIEIDIRKVWKAIEEMVKIRKKPPVSVIELVQQISDRGMKMTARRLKKDVEL